MDHSGIGLIFFYVTSFEIGLSLLTEQISLFQPWPFPPLAQA
jgi:hypothetical protein